MDIEIKGNIVDDSSMWFYDWLGISAVCPKSVNKSLKEANGEKVTVKINSPGGNVFSASEIYSLLREYKGELNIKILGLAASAASVIAMAGKSEMAPTAQIMIHPVSTRAEGTHLDMEHTAEVLRNADQTVANAYILKTGKSEKKILDMMNKETWLSAQKAKELGFIDEIMFDDDTLNKFQNIDKIDIQGMSNSLIPIPRDVINKIKQLNKKPKISQSNIDKTNFFMLKKAQTQLNLMKLGGIMNE